MLLDNSNQDKVGFSRTHIATILSNFCTPVRNQATRIALSQPWDAENARAHAPVSRDRIGLRPPLGSLFPFVQARSSDQRSPSPRAMMPRRISVVPPWMVSLGAISVANASCCSKVARLAASSSAERGQIAGPVRQLLLPDGADVLDDGCFHHRLLAGVQHARHRHRHAPQRMHLRHQPPEAFGAADVGLLAQHPHQLGQHVVGLQEPLRAAALIGKLARSPASRRRPPRPARGRPA